MSSTIRRGPRRPRRPENIREIAAGVKASPFSRWPAKSRKTPPSDGDCFMVQVTWITRGVRRLETSKAEERVGFSRT